MKCYHPLKAFPVGLTSNNKTKYKITDYKANHIEINSNNNIEIAYDNYKGQNCVKAVSDFIEIPCGQCIGCRINYAEMWADRCSIEMQYHKSNYFVTLTYDPEFLPHAIDKETGEILPYGTLQKRDFQLFMKRLRRAVARRTAAQGAAVDQAGARSAPATVTDNIKFFASGEYGTVSGRPHYHALIFGLELDDLVFYKKSKLGYNYYNSAFLDSLWYPEKDAHKKEKRSMGFIVVAEATWETAAYTAKYILKKQKGSAKSVYTDLCVEPEFSLMSRSEGIGKKLFLEKGLSLYDYNEFYLATAEGSKAIRPPRYFDKLAQLMQEDCLLERKQLNKEVSEVVKQHQLSETDNDYLSMLECAETNFKSKLDSIRHSL